MVFVARSAAGFALRAADLGGLLLGPVFVFAVLFPLVASALCFWFISVAPVRGSTYFSLQRQRKVGKRKPLLNLRCPPG
jgi:hypothetical protein